MDFPERDKPPRDEAPREKSREGKKGTGKHGGAKCYRASTSVRSIRRLAALVPFSVVAEGTFVPPRCREGEN